MQQSTCFLGSCVARGHAFLLWFELHIPSHCDKGRYRLGCFLIGIASIAGPILVCAIAGRCHKCETNAPPLLSTE